MGISLKVAKTLVESLYGLVDGLIAGMAGMVGAPKLVNTNETKYGWLMMPLIFHRHHYIVAPFLLLLLLLLLVYNACIAVWARVCPCVCVCVCMYFINITGLRSSQRRDIERYSNSYTVRICFCLHNLYFQQERNTEDLDTDPFYKVCIQ